MKREIFVGTAKFLIIFFCLIKLCCFCRNGNQLINLGTMSTKLAVHATSDVFRQTKETMKTAQEEWTKVRCVCQQE